MHSTNLASTLRPAVFILIEIKVRELRAKVLLATALADLGFRVYLGTRQAIRQAMDDPARSGPSGVYFFKGGETEQAMRAAQLKCQFVVGQDEELGPALSDSEFARVVPVRFPPGFAGSIDRLMLFSDVQKKLLADIAPRLAERSTMTGWPRADLWSPALRGADQQRARQILRRREPFVLFVSNFKVSSIQQRDHVIGVARRRLQAAQSQEAGASAIGDVEGPGDPEFGSRATARLDAFGATVQLLKRVAPQSPVPIVVRPHPAEHPRDWTRALGTTPNVSVEHRGEVGPWMLAAHGILHTGCTSAVQAWHYGVACGYLSEYGFGPDDAETSGSWAASTILRSEDDCIAFIATCRDRGSQPGGLQSGEVANHPRLGPHDGSASRRIAEVVAALEPEAEPPLRALRRVAAQRMVIVKSGRAIRWARSHARNIRLVGSNAQPKVAGGIHAPEVRRIAVRDLDRADLQITEPRLNLVSIERLPGGPTE